MLEGGRKVRVVLVTHEQPAGLPYDERLIVRSVSSPVPTGREEMMHDKYAKTKVALTVARQFAPTWLMRADADDLISRRLVPFVEQQQVDTAWYCETGWAYRPGSYWTMRLQNFHRVCGTSCVTYVNPHELPDTIDRPNADYYLLTKGHNIIVDFLKQSGVGVRPIPFPAVVYVTGHGDNWSGSSFFNRRSRRWQIGKIINTRPIAPLRHEFGLTRHSMLQ
jgi:hypothetical protein